MPSGKHKSGSLRKIFRKTPGGKNVLRYEAGKPSQHKCADCGRSLPGIPRLRPTEMQNAPKTKKRPERPFGGFLCSSCARKRIISENRS